MHQALRLVLWKTAEGRIARAMARADRHDSRMALLFIDLDGFKPINDRLGHAVGDHTLKAVAESLCWVFE